MNPIITKNISQIESLCKKYKVKELYAFGSVTDEKKFNDKSDVDLLVNFDKNKIDWQKPVSDAIYIRRIYLDITGLLPPADSVDVFIKNNQSGKREALVNELLNKNDEYAQHWLTFWNDAPDIIYRLVLASCVSRKFI